jgi:hypothetical protein
LRLTKSDVALTVQELQLRQTPYDHEEEEHDDGEYADRAAARIGAARVRATRGTRGGTTAPSRDGSTGSRRDFATIR